MVSRKLVYNVVLGRRVLEQNGFYYNFFNVEDIFDAFLELVCNRERNEDKRKRQQNKILFLHKVKPARTVIIFLPLSYSTKGWPNTFSSFHFTLIDVTHSGLLETQLAKCVESTKCL